MEYRVLQKNEIKRIREIDRREIIQKVYKYEKGKLTEKSDFFEVGNEWWIEHEVEKKFIPRLEKLYDRGGTIVGVFDGDKTVGMAALNSEFIGEDKDTLDLDILFVSHDYRNKGIGHRLMEIMKEKARELGAEKIYISATPSGNTVKFYRNLGCRIAEEADEGLFEMEPEDIHMILKV